jgi:cellulose synthase/poly-beta-1,6-N-acetylglucosamine synthase-like glycosyltransferase
MLIFELALIVIALGAALPCAVFFLECLLGSVFPSRREQIDAGPRPRTAVLVPAHDESAGLAPTLADVTAELGPGDRLLVVADNCSDDTAAVAAASGAQVVERHDAERRGKGYALAFGLEHLSKDPPDAVIIVDADCRISPGSIDRLSRLAVLHGRPVQADYLLQLSQHSKGRPLINALAFLIKNRVRPRGLAVLGLPCLLTGTGMAFTWEVIGKAPPTKDHLVEDMVMGLELARLGYPPMLCSHAHVSSVLPERTQAAMTQRKRWEHGHLATLLAYGPKLLTQGVAQARIDLVALALDLMVPPLSLLVLMVLGGALVSALALLAGGSAIPLAIFILNILAVAFGVLIGWFAYGRTLIGVWQLLAIPLYVLWKIPLYFAFFARRRQVGWERTERSAGYKEAQNKPMTKKDGEDQVAR